MIYYMSTTIAIVCTYYLGLVIAKGFFTMKYSYSNKTFKKIDSLKYYLWFLYLPYVLIKRTLNKKSKSYGFRNR